MNIMKIFKFIDTTVFRDTEAAFLGADATEISNTTAFEIKGNGEFDRVFFDAMLRIAFNAKEASDRGKAWVKLAFVSESENLRKLLTPSARCALADYFRLDPGALDDVGINRWLDGISSMVGICRTHALVRQSLRRRLEMQGAEDLAVMSRSPELALEFLSHVNPMRRTAAIKALAASMCEPSLLASALAARVLEDKNAAVRIAALRNYISVNRKAPQPDALPFLANIVLDESAPIELRDLSYEGLFEISAAPVTEWPITRACCGRFEFPRDVDWEFVTRCHQQAGRGNGGNGDDGGNGDAVRREKV